LKSLFVFTSLVQNPNHMPNYVFVVLLVWWLVLLLWCLLIDLMIFHISMLNLKSKVFNDKEKVVKRVDALSFVT